MGWTKLSRLLTSVIPPTVRIEEYGNRETVTDKEVINVICEGSRSTGAKMSSKESYTNDEGKDILEQTI